MTLCQVKGKRVGAKKRRQLTKKYVQYVLFSGITTAVDRSVSLVFLWPESDLN
jgi:hypothetical protein